MTGLPLLERTWTDPVTGRQGFVVIDRLIRGISSGGLRLREGCTLDEVRGLARGMTLKEAIAFDPADRYVPLGGAKGGLAVNGTDPQARDILVRFLSTLRPLVHEQWNFGEDFGVRQELLDEVAIEVGLPSTVESVFQTLPDPQAARRRLRAGFAADVDGVPLADSVGGYGVAEAGLMYAKWLGPAAGGATAAVQGFGSIGGSAARYLDRAGVRVIVVADRAGLILNEDGLDIESMLAGRDPSGAVDRAGLRPGDRQLPGEDWLAVPADILVPAAMSYVIPLDAVDRIRARVVVEGANMPTLPAAETALAARGIPVVPDFLANLGTNAWWYWVIFGDIAPTPKDSFAKLSVTMRRLVDTVAAEAERDRVTVRDAATALAERNARALAAEFG